MLWFSALVGPHFSTGTVIVHMYNTYRAPNVLGSAA